MAARTAKQIAASRRNIKKAQAARRGMRTVYHHTRARNADSIVQQGFKAYSEADRAFFSTKKHGLAGAYGRAVVGVKIHQSKIVQDPRQSQFPNGERFVSIKLKDLEGVPLQRIKRAIRR